MTRPHAFIHLDDRHVPALAGLLAEYATALSGTAHTADTARAQALISEPAATVWGAFKDGKLAGFAMVYELLEAVSGMRCGQLDDLYIAPEARGASLAEQLIGAISDDGRAKGWVHLRWLAPEGAAAARRLYDRIATPKPWQSYAITLNPGAGF